MPPKAKAGVVAQLSGTTSNESPNLGGRPKKQKVAFEEAAKDIALGKVQTITSLLGKRNVRPADDLGGSSSSPASAAPLSTSAVTAAPALRPAVRPFANSDELGQAVWAAVRVTGKSRWMHLRQVACSVCLAAWPIKMLCARAHLPRLAACRRHAERRGWWGLSRWYIYHLKWYIYHFEVIWLRVGILLKSQIPVNEKHCTAVSFHC